MEQALCNFQPACVICGVTDDLTRDHIRPVSQGHALEPGNAVRLCRACNSFKRDRDLEELPPEIAERLEPAAAKFKEFWEAGCAVKGIREPFEAIEWPPPAPDPTVIALLRRLHSGDECAIPDLARYLEVRGDDRAGAISALTKLESVVEEIRTEDNELAYQVQFLRDGRSCGGSYFRLRSPQDIEESLAKHVRELLRRHRTTEVWRRLGLSDNDANALWQYFGIGPPPGGMSARQYHKAQKLRQVGGIAMSVLPGDALPGGVSVQQIAVREGVRVQTVRNRILQALDRLDAPQV
jgi:hypothetical protein